MTLAFTGCRLSEALALTADRVDLAGGVVVFETLKKHRAGIDVVIGGCVGGTVTGAILANPPVKLGKPTLSHAVRCPAPSGRRY